MKIRLLTPAVLLVGLLVVLPGLLPAHATGDFSLSPTTFSMLFEQVLSKAQTKVYETVQIGMSHRANVPRDCALA